MIKTRIVVTEEDKYIPQVYIPHFLWGGHWEGVQQKEQYTFYTFEWPSAQIRNCQLDTHKEAEKVLYWFKAFKQTEKVLNDD